MLELIENNKELLVYVCTFFGLFARVAYTTYNGLKKSENTPNIFDPMYWIKDNVRQKIISLGSLTTILSTQMESILGENKWMVFLAGFLSGILADWASEIIVRIGPVKPKTKLIKLKR
jgi:hypothetical protein